jgi:hypothetical protein
VRRLAAAVFAVVAACSSGPPVPLRWTDDELAIVGDSIVFEAGGEFDRLARERGWELTIHAVPGTTFADSLGEIEDLSGRRRSAVVVELGTNDALADGDFTDDEAGDIDTAVDALADVGCVLFVNAGLLEPANQDVLTRSPWDDYAPGLRAAQALNRHLERVAGERPNHHILDWYAQYNRNPEWTRDFVHLKQAHHGDYARFVLDGLSDACRRGTTSS